MVKISAYTTCFNPIFWFSTIEATVKSALKFSDEVVVLDGGSTDGTIELLEAIGDDRIKIFVEPDKYELGRPWLAHKKTSALNKTTGDWAVLMDADEVIGEWNAKKIRELAESEMWAFFFGTLHFYRDWNRIQIEPDKKGGGWYQSKIYMVKKGLGIHHGSVGMDRDNFVINGQPLADSKFMRARTDIKVFHYGWCRPDSVLLMKKWTQEIDWWSPEYWKTHEFPFQFENPNTLTEFTGQHPKWMKDLIKEKWRWIREFNNDWKGFPWVKTK